MLIESRGCNAGCTVGITLNQKAQGRAGIEMSFHRGFPDGLDLSSVEEYLVHVVYGKGPDPLEDSCDLAEQFCFNFGSGLEGFRSMRNTTLRRPIPSTP